MRHLIGVDAAREDLKDMLKPLRGRNRLFTHTGVLALIGDGREV